MKQFYDFTKKTLGKGQYGHVQLAVHKISGKKVAIKEVKKSRLRAQVQQFQQRREIEVLKMCQHPNIVGLVDVFEDQENHHIVMEYMRGSDLFDHLQGSNYNLSE